MSDTHAPTGCSQRRAVEAAVRHAALLVVSGHSAASACQALAVLGRRSTVHTQSLSQPLGCTVLSLRLRALRLVLDSTGLGPDLSPVFQHLPEPNRACLVGVYAFLIWNNLCDLVYQTPNKSCQSQIPVAFGIPGHMTTKHLPDTPC